MVLLDEDNNSVILSGLQTPLKSNYFWILDLQLVDFTLTPIKIIEEYWGPTISIEVEDVIITVPKKWHILITDPEISSLDILEINKLSRQPYSVVVYDNERSIAYGTTVKVIDYQNYGMVINPSLNRHHMFCHPISNSRWICIAPNDSYNKYLKDTVIGDIF